MRLAPSLCALRFDAICPARNQNEAHMIRITTRTVLFVLLLAAVFGGGMYVASWWHARQLQQAHIQSDILLEKVRKVAKLVTVEGHFTELYSHKDFWGYDFSPFRKKALLRINATVQVGYDLEKMQIEMVPAQRKIVISNLPDPEILSIDHSVDYYDIQEGTFNYFTPEDYTAINRKAKEYIREKARQSKLFEMAARQGNEMLELIEFMAASAGWTVEYREAPPAIRDTLQH